MLHIYELLDIDSKEFVSSLSAFSVRAQPEAAFPAKAEGGGAAQQPFAPQEGWTHHHCQEAVPGCGRSVNLFRVAAFQTMPNPTVSQVNLETSCGKRIPITSHVKPFDKLR